MIGVIAIRTISAWMRVPLGSVIGLFASVIVLAVIQWSTARTEALPSTLMSDCDGAIGEIVIHYVSEAGDVVEDVYREFLRQLSRDVVVQVVCPDRSAFDDLGTRIGTTRCRLTPVIVGHPMTTWSRDRWLALQRAGGGLTTLLCPRSEKSEECWPQRAGDAQVGWDLACTLGNRIAFRHAHYISMGVVSRTLTACLSLPTWPCAIFTNGRNPCRVVDSP